jgi:transcription-repair coupling factor (superfamily II helicase)
MAEVGFQLYTDMLRSAVSALKAGREPNLAEPLGVTTEIQLHVPARLPEQYCNDIHERLVLYKRLATAEDAAGVDAIVEEIVDRFGPLPEPAIALVASHRLRIAAKPLGVRKIDAGPERTTIQFVPQPPFDPAKLILRMQRDGRTRFSGPDRVRIDRAAPMLDERIALVREFLGTLA